MAGAAQKKETGLAKANGEAANLANIAAAVKAVVNEPAAPAEVKTEAKEQQTEEKKEPAQQPQKPA